MRIIDWIKEVKWRYLITGTYCRVCKGGKLSIAEKVALRNSRIYVYPGSELCIHNNAEINHCTISINQGTTTIGSGSIIGKGHRNCLINVENGELSIGSHSFIKTDRIWIRFGGRCSIGNFCNINEGSEIRCDSSVTIGDYNQISYKVNIWDTNTHSIIKKEERRAITEEHFPYFGFEKERPVAAPVKIGDDCWIGQNATILKGSIIQDEVIVGYGCFIAGQTIPTKSTVVNDIQLKTWQRND